MYALAFPLSGIWLFGWVFAVPLFYISSECDAHSGFFFGAVSGLVAWAGLLYWIAYVMNLYGGLSLGASAMVLLLLLAYLSLYFGFFVVLTRFVVDKRHAFLSVPGIWIGLELVRSWLLSGFPWALAGYSQFPLKPLIQVAEFGGVYLVSGILLMANVALFKILKKEAMPVVVTVCIVLICVFWGQARMEEFDGSSPDLRAGIAQADIRQDEKWLPEMVDPTIDIYSRLTRAAEDRGASVVVWPETACNFFLFSQKEPTGKILELSRNTSATLVAGSPAFSSGKYYNRVWTLADGWPSGYYDKVHLVPFGEYLPLSWLLEPVFGKLTQGVSDFSSGSRIKPVGDMGVLVCFESIIPGLSRHLCLNGAKYLVNVSNDAWFETWSAPEQLLEMSSFRAIETRRWVVRSVNHGVSAFIDPSGRIVSSLGLLEEGVLVEDIVMNDELTFWSRYGILFPVLWSVLAAVLSALTIFGTGVKSWKL